MILQDNNLVGCVVGNELTIDDAKRDEMFTFLAGLGEVANIKEAVRLLDHEYVFNHDEHYKRDKLWGIVSDYLVSLRPKTTFDEII